MPEFHTILKCIAEHDETIESNVNKAATRSLFFDPTLSGLCLSEDLVLLTTTRIHRYPAEPETKRGQVFGK